MNAKVIVAILAIGGVATIVFSQSFSVPSGSLNGGAATNAVTTIRTNGVDLTSAATILDIIQGSNSVLRATNNSGNVSFQVNAASGSGSGIDASTATNIANARANAKNVYYMEDFGAVEGGVTDNSLALSNAIYTAAGGAKTNEAVNVKIKFPPGKFAFTLNPWSPTVENAQVGIPLRNSLTAADISDWSTITIEGAGPPPGDDGSNVSSARATNGTILLTTITNGNFFRSMGATNAALLNLTTIIFQDLTIQVPSTNYNGTALNLGDFVCARMDRVTVRTEMSHGNLNVAPVYGSTGIEMPRKDNGSEIGFDRIDVSGFSRGIKIAEHTIGGTINISGCSNGVYMVSGNYPNSIDYLIMYGVSNGIQSDGNSSTLYVNMFGNERLNTTGWRSNAWDIVGANAIKGSINWYCKDDINAANSLKPRLSGVTYMNINLISDQGSSIWSGTDSLQHRGPRIKRFSDDGIAPAFSLGKARGTPGTPAAASSTDVLGILNWMPHDGNAFTNGPYLYAIATGSASGGVVPGRFDFAPSNGVVSASIFEKGIGIGTTTPATGTSLDVTGRVVSASLRITNEITTTALKWNIWTNYVQTASNFVFSFNTNRYELKNQTNVVFTNIVEEATAVGADLSVHIHNTTGVTMGLVWPGYGAQHGYFFQTNINNPILTSTSLATGKHGVASFTAFGTNIFATWNEWP